MDSYFEQIRRFSTLAVGSAEQLAASGFVVIPGPLSGNRLHELATAYDDLMNSACGPDFKVGSTTTRISDPLSFNSGFDEVFVHPPLLEACGHIIGQPFKLSSLLARTLRAGAPAQPLHADLPRDSEDSPLVGFILMVDAFLEENGATRFVPCSHLWVDLPSDEVSDTRAKYPGQVLGCGEPGTMIVFNGAIWHGHTANLTSRERRSIQGYFVRRNAPSGFDLRKSLPPAVRTRMSPLHQYLLAFDE